ncbi:hypothetical protein PPERSA_02514 [Pseudocohnilembus persalinus]|uniref:Uncharacterized protein n=1 Tax=Pseudocohnilembus persalinus TaxID=266149 RepID=A0A0V0QB70_PSEPJ|nr:hypothetical protein PPERSA_02514 [Pseudocohnilembus persalinus]|eukprot:KRW99402.1 hypothetical protein PPERSA_02514 [Pseudocohnilembus persalinus]
MSLNFTKNKNEMLHCLKCIMGHNQDSAFKYLEIDDILQQPYWKWDNFPPIQDQDTKKRLKIVLENCQKEKIQHKQEEFNQAIKQFFNTKKLQMEQIFNNMQKSIIQEFDSYFKSIENFERIDKFQEYVSKFVKLEVNQDQLFQQQQSVYDLFENNEKIEKILNQEKYNEYIDDCFQNYKDQLNLKIDYFKNEVQLQQNFQKKPLLFQQLKKKQNQSLNQIRCLDQDHETQIQSMENLIKNLRFQLENLKTKNYIQNKHLIQLVKSQQNPNFLTNTYNFKNQLGHKNILSNQLISQKGSILNKQDIFQHEINLAFGNTPIKSYIGLNVVRNCEVDQIQNTIIKGFQKINLGAPSIILKLCCFDANQALNPFQDLMEQIFVLAENIGDPQLANDILPGIKYEVIAENNHILIGIQMTNEVFQKVLKKINAYPFTFIPEESPIKAQLDLNLGFNIKDLLNNKDEILDNVILQQSFGIKYNQKVDRQTIYNLRDFEFDGVRKKYKNKFGKLTNDGLKFNLITMQDASIHLNYKSLRELLKDVFRDFSKEETIQKYYELLQKQKNFTNILNQIPLFKELSETFKKHINPDIQLNLLTKKQMISLQIQILDIIELYDFVFQNK